MNKKALVLRLAPVILLLSVLAIVPACQSSTGTNTGNSVTIVNFAFSPASITVAVDSKVTWTNKDSVAHNVTSATGLFSSGLINPGASYSYTFTAAGTYNYTCTIHSMNGTVIVQ